MIIRKYCEMGSSKKVVVIIAGEVIESGKSNGWQGSLYDFAGGWWQRSNYPKGKECLSQADIDNERGSMYIFPISFKRE